MLGKPYLSVLVLGDTGLWNFVTVGAFSTQDNVFCRCNKLHLPYLRVAPSVLALYLIYAECCKQPSYFLSTVCLSTQIAKTQVIGHMSFQLCIHVHIKLYSTYYFFIVSLQVSYPESLESRWEIRASNSDSQKLRSLSTGRRR